MKNALGKKESLTLYNDKGNLVYSFFTYQSILCSERTYNDRGNLLTFKHSDGDWSKFTYDDKGNQLTYEDSDGVTITHNTPEYTMEELTKIVGKEFKIKKQ